MKHTMLEKGVMPGSQAEGYRAASAMGPALKRQRLFAQTLAGLAVLLSLGAMAEAVYAQECVCPMPAIYVSNPSPLAGEVVRFTAGPGYYEGHPPLWDMGDATHLVGPSVEHVYSRCGVTVTVVLTTTVLCDDGVYRTAFSGMDLYIRCDDPPPCRYPYWDCRDAAPPAEE